MRNVWRLIAHHNEPERALKWTRQSGRIAIGWGSIGDISKKGYRSPEDIAAAIRAVYPHKRNSGSGGLSLWNLYAEMKIGDLVILSARKPRVLVVEVRGQFFWDEEGAPVEEEYQHQRRVGITTYNPERLWKDAGGLAQGQSVYQTLLKCASPVE